MQPLISVIIPTYNHSHFLEKAIQSVIDQTYSFWELLIVDNHSQDNTDSVVRSFNDTRIKLLKIHNNGVIAASRNMGILNARGEWVAFLDSDDSWYSEKLETLINDLRKSDVYDVISNDELMVDNNTGEKQVLHYGPYEDNFYEVLLIDGNRLSPSATMIRRSFLIEQNLLFNEAHDYIAVEDYDLWLKLALKNAKFKFNNIVLGEYLVHHANNSAQLLRQRKNAETLLHDHVFKIQQFTQAEKLWNSFGPRLKMMEIRQLMGDGYSAQAIKKAMIMFLTHPLGTLDYFFNKLSKRFKKQ